MKKIICILCVFALLFSICGATVSAVPAPGFAGYVDSDEAITVKDATLVQKYVAGIEELGFMRQCFADVDDDGRVTVKDATAIQKHVAKIEKIIYKEIYPYITVESFYSDYASGKAMVGVPVTFKAEARSWDELGGAVKYTFKINDEIIVSDTEVGEFTYTFTEAGEYIVRLIVKNNFSPYGDEKITQYINVVEPYDSETPVIKTIYNTSHPCQLEVSGQVQYVEKNVTFAAEAIFGEGDYEYAFLLNGELLRDYSEDNTYTFETLPEVSETPYILTVRVKDSSTGDGFVSEDYELYVTWAIDG